LGDTGVDERIILRSIIRKCEVGIWTQVADTCDFGNETSGSIKWEEIS
jgi:hypothetical protein